MRSSLRRPTGAATRPEALDRVLLKALRKEPQERYPTARALREALEAVLAGLPPARPRRAGCASTTTSALGSMTRSGRPSTNRAPMSAGREDRRRGLAPGKADRGAGAPPRRRSRRLEPRARGRRRPPPKPPGRSSRSSPGRPTNLGPAGHQLRRPRRRARRSAPALPPGRSAHHPARPRRHREDAPVAAVRGRSWSRTSRTVDSSGRRRGGVWFCDLTEAADVDGLCSAVARGAGGAARCRTTPCSSSATPSSPAARCCVVLDNFEQVVSHAGETRGAVDANRPRGPLRGDLSRGCCALPHETVFEVPAAAHAERPRGGAAPPRRCSSSSSAPAPRGPAGSPLRATSAAVAEIVRQLDGMPLAIELAAGAHDDAQPHAAGAAAAAALRPAGGRKGARERQATLRGAIDWSWQMLSPAEASALAQLSVFRGGFTTRGRRGGGRPVAHLAEGPTPLEALMTLRAKSLVRAYFPAGDEGETRFGLYETIREYAAREARRHHGRGAATLERHARLLPGAGRTSSRRAPRAAAAARPARPRAREPQRRVPARARRRRAGAARAAGGAGARPAADAARALRAHLVMLDAALEPAWR